jgi:hypothetical protein
MLAVTTPEASHAIVFRYCHLPAYVNQSKSLLTNENFHVTVTIKVSVNRIAGRLGGKTGKKAGVRGGRRNCNTLKRMIRRWIYTISYRNIL